MSGTDNADSKDNRERIVRGAMRLVRCSGNEYMSAAWIGERIGVPVEELLRIFPDIGALWREMLTCMEGELMDLLEHSSEYGRDAFNALECMLKCHVSFISHNIGMARVLFSTLMSEDVHLKRHIRKILKRYEADIAVMICLGKSEGTVRYDVDAERAAALFVTLIQGLALRMLTMTHSDQEIKADEVDRICALFLDGIRIRPVSEG